ncbi:MAG: hypothetical protein LAT67_15610 [Balneolales bacterium]|nr:hypothetical protein [Balneolales bacterium]
MAQQEILKKGILDVGKFFDEQFYILHNGEDFKVSILDSDFEIIGSYIRDGDGPSEARHIKAMYVDQQERKIYVLKRPGILMTFDEEFGLISEAFLGSNPNAGSMVVVDNTVYFSLNHFFLPATGDSQIQFIEYRDLDNPTESNRISISSDALAISNRQDLRNLNATRFTSKLTVHNNQIYAVLMGHPHIYRFNPARKEIEETISIDYYQDSEFRVVSRELQGYGFSIPSANTSIFVHENLIYTSHGVSPSQKKPSLVIYNPDSKQTTLLSGIETMTASPIIRLLNGKMVVYESLAPLSNYMMIYNSNKIDALSKDNR